MAGRIRKRVSLCFKIIIPREYVHLYLVLSSKFPLLLSSQLCNLRILPSIFVFVASLNKFNTLIFESAVDSSLRNENLPVNVKGHDVGGSGSLVLLWFEGHDQFIVGVGHKLEAREAVCRIDVTDSLALIGDLKKRLFKKRNKKRS